MKKLLLTLSILLTSFTGFATELFFDKTYSAHNFNSSPVTISGLEGDAYDYYVIMWIKPSASHDGTMRVYPNNDTTISNYRQYNMSGYSSTAAASVLDTADQVQFITMRLQTICFGMMKITGSSGDERYFDIFTAGRNGVANEIRKTSCYWKNTGNELTSLVFKDGQSYNIDARIIVYRSLKGISQGRWEWLETKTISSQDVLSSYTLFSGLSLDADKAYKMDYHILETTTSDLGFLVNDDNTSSTYTQQVLRNSGGTIQANNTSAENILTGDNGNSAVFEGSMTLQGESGSKRLISFSQGQINKAFHQIEHTTWWSNTADDLDSIEIKKYGVSGSTTTTGTFSLYRQSQGYRIGDNLPFRVHETVEVSGDFSAGHTFTGLSGDDYKMLKVEFIGDGSPELRMQINSDTGSNYQRQYLRGNSSTASAATLTQTSFLIADPTASKQAALALYIYPKSGENRPMLGGWFANENDMQIHAGWWLNSADPITDIKVFASNTSTVTGTLKLSILR